VTKSLLVVDDDPAIRKIVGDRFRSLGFNVAVARDGKEALASIDERPTDVVLLDLQMPNLDGFGVLEDLARRAERPAVIVVTAHGSIDAAVRAVKMGAVDLITKPFDAAHLEHVVNAVLDRGGLRRRIEVLERELSERHTLVLGRSRAMREANDLAVRSAASEATVLLRGESGTGKEVLARAIHLGSRRARGPFVAINCATLGPELLESELFGHEKGAFTGATRSKPGRVELAAGGTLFLDEIGELPTAVQAKLLRVLQEREFERVGGTRAVAADVRIVAATHRDLAAAIVDGTFRKDLYYRLNVVSIRVPPLRERIEDLPALLEHFLRRFAAETGRRELRFSPDALALLERYSWPGNVREVANVVERAVVLSDEAELGIEILPEEIVECAGSAPTANRTYHDAVLEAKRAIVRDALRRTGGHQTRAAELLGMGQPYLARLIRNLGLREG